MPSEDGLLETLRSVLEPHDEVDLAILFGSRARGRSEREADVDLGVVGDGVDRLSLVAEIGEATGLEIDVVDLAAAGYPLLQAVLRDGIVAHEGDRHAAGHRPCRFLSPAP